MGVGGCGGLGGCECWGEGGSNLIINPFEKELEQKFKISNFIFDFISFHFIISFHNQLEGGRFATSFQLAGRLRRPSGGCAAGRAASPPVGRLRRQKMTKKSKNRLLNFEVLHEKLKTVLPMQILKIIISTTNFTKFLNP